MDFEYNRYFVAAENPGAYRLSCYLQRIVVYLCAHRGTFRSTSSAFGWQRNKRRLGLGSVIDPTGLSSLARIAETDDILREAATEVGF